MSTRNIILSVLSGIILIIFISLAGNIWETNQAGFFQVKQAAFTGNMSARQNPGMYMQMFGDIHTYKNVATVGIGDEEGEGSANITAVPITFNDASKATQSALVRVKLPATTEQQVALKKRFSGGFNHFIRSGVVPVVKNAIKLAANLRTSQESYTALAPYQQDVEDQLKNGAYKTITINKTIKDPRTGELKTTIQTEIVKDPKTGIPIRINNVLQDLGCEILSCVLSIPEYDKLTTSMIAKRKQQAMETNLAKQKAVRAQQDRITAEEQGKADIAKKEAEMLVLKKEAVVHAEQKRDVALLDVQEAKAYKQAKILRAEADAAYKKKVMSADGALEQKLAAWTAVNIARAENLAKIKVPIVSATTIGGSSKGSSSNRYDSYLGVMAAKAARDLGLDMNMKTE